MNNINRQTYETFFLLYTDNELSVAERKAVEEFVSINPDLQEELIMLQQSILKPEDVVFEDKSSLLKNDSLPAGIPEKLMLYLDDELSLPDRKELETKISADKMIERELNILQQTKLVPESIVFTDKKSLYRKEPGRLVIFRVWKFAAAAVLIGLGVWGGLKYINNEPAIKIDQTAVKTPAKQVPARVEATVDPAAATGTNIPVVEKELAVTKSSDKKSSISPVIQANKKVALKGLAKQDIAVEEKSPTNNLPKPYFDNVNNIDRNNTITANVTPKKQSSTIVDPKNNDIVNGTGKLDPANLFAANTSFTDNKEENNDRVLFMKEEKLKKTKLGGIFRKVKRVLERSASIKQDGNSNNIKVANFEFAIQ
ncbi:MAG: hypothetical protein JWP81_62 [Ferruginibacter sp.]|nr:hypothetical protein [Ferruginibacter sp.]